MKKLLTILAVVFLFSTIVACSSSDNGTNGVSHIDEVEATCHQDGNIEYWTKDGKYYLDKDCSNEITRDQTVTKGEHTFGQWIAQIDSTCREEGEVAHKDCTVCGKHFNSIGIEIENKNLSIAKADHSWNNGSITTPANMMEDGEKTYTCKICNETKKESYSSDELTFLKENFGSFEGTANKSLVKLSDLETSMQTGVGTGFVPTTSDAFVLKAVPTGEYNTAFIKFKQTYDAFAEKTDSLKITVKMYFDYTTSDNLFVKVDTRVGSAQEEANGYTLIETESIKGQWVDVEFTVDNGKILDKEDLEYLAFCFADDTTAELYIADIKVENIANFDQNFASQRCIGLWSSTKESVAVEWNDTYKIYYNPADPTKPMVFDSDVLAEAVEQGYTKLIMRIIGHPSNADGKSYKLYCGDTVVDGVTETTIGTMFSYSDITLNFADLKKSDDTYYLGLVNSTEEAWWIATNILQFVKPTDLTQNFATESNLSYFISNTGNTTVSYDATYAIKTVAAASYAGETQAMHLNSTLISGAVEAGYRSVTIQLKTDGTNNNIHLYKGSEVSQITVNGTDTITINLSDLVKGSDYNLGIKSTANNAPVGITSLTFSEEEVTLDYTQNFATEINLSYFISSTGNTTVSYDATYAIKTVAVASYAGESQAMHLNSTLISGAVKEGYKSVTIEVKTDGTNNNIHLYKGSDVFEITVNGTDTITINLSDLVKGSDYNLGIKNAANSAPVGITSLTFSK